MKNLTKKQRVEKYLNQLMKGRYFKIDDLLSLTPGKLQENTPLLDISQSTIAPVLNAFKEKFNPKNKKPTTPRNGPQDNQTGEPAGGLQASEIALLRRMIDWFDNRRKEELAEFEDLKSALFDIGIDYRMLLKKHRKRK